ncbi:MAG: redoxin domain-containing protein [Planctomycetes bacterium]|nr:redoxin domain-containing protein [Planctomycetota bacterium]
MKALPSNQALWNEFKDRGLHMFLINCQDSTKEEMEKYALARGLTMPIAIHLECDFIKYDGGQRLHLPYSYVIGPDGKVAWQGGGDGYVAEVRKQLARIKYVKLRRMEIAPELVPAATQFEAGEYAAARAAALKIKEAAPNDAAVADAEYVVTAVDDHVMKLRLKIDELKAGRRYHEAIPMLEALAGKAYKGLPLGDEAGEELKELKKDKQVKEELKAWDQLAKTHEANKKAKSDEERRTNLEKFIKKYEGTAAAEEAAGLLP